MSILHWLWPRLSCLAPFSTQFLNSRLPPVFSQCLTCFPPHYNSRIVDIYLNICVPIIRLSAYGMMLFKETRNKHVPMALAWRNCCRNSDVNPYWTEHETPLLCSACTSTLHLMWADDVNEIRISFWVTVYCPTVRGMRRLGVTRYCTLSVCHLGNLGCNQTLPFRQLFT